MYSAHTFYACFIHSFIPEKDHRKCSNFADLHISVLSATIMEKGEYMAARQRITIHVSLADHRKIKMLASMMDLSVKDLMLISFQAFTHRRFNRITEKAIKQTLAGKNLKKFEILDELIEDLEK
jgi:hypothetical protein